MKEKNYTYILKCNDNTLYTGWTNNLENRIINHNSKKGAKYTKNRIPCFLLYFEEFDDKKEAMKREYEIKQLSRKEKEEIVSNFKLKRRITRRDKINSMIEEMLADNKKK